MKKVLLGIASIPIFVTALVAWPYIYNYHLFSLAQLKNSIEIGDDFSLVSDKFREYEKKHEGGNELHVSIKSDYLFIYHVNSFDDCQLMITFDNNSKVKNIDYIGD